MKTPIGNGLTTPHSQPAKTLTKYATDFIARCTIIASANAGLYVAFAVVLLQAVLMVVKGLYERT